MSARWNEGITVDHLDATTLPADVSVTAQIGSGLVALTTGGRAWTVDEARAVGMALIEGAILAGRDEIGRRDLDLPKVDMCRVCGYEFEWCAGHCGSGGLCAA